MAIGAGRIERRRMGGGGGEVRCENGLFALLHEPAGEHGSRILFEPLIEKRTNFLAEIGGVAEARKFVALKRVTGSGEKELPGRLSGIVGQGTHRDYLLQKYGRYPSTITHRVNSNSRVMDLWKTVEAVEKYWRACSGCAGDYEDPDRSAWVPWEEENEGDSEDAESPVPNETAEREAGEEPEAE
jgi:hypothetical protein